MRVCQHSKGGGLPASLRLAMVAASGVLLAACGGAIGSVTPLAYGRTAEESYERGVQELGRKGTDRARKLFKHVQRRFQYSRYATLAELRLADCDFSDEQWAEAAASYRRFMRLHPTHANVDHAAFRRGLSYYKMIPRDWFLVPPSHERDMSATRDALRELRAFVRDYPDSRYRPEATKLVGDCYKRLATHEMYVARFYLRRNKFRAAIGRTEVVERRYPDSGMVPEAMFVRGETLVRMGERDEAIETFRRLAGGYPESRQAQRAHEYLRHLGAESAPGGEADEPEGSVGEPPAAP